MKKATTKSSSMGTIEGVFPAPSTPKKMAAGNSRENLESLAMTRSLLGRHVGLAESETVGRECGSLSFGAFAAFVPFYALVLLRNK